MHLDAAHTVLVERVPADAHDHGEDGGLVARGGRGREARPAVVDAGGNVVVAADGEALDGDVRGADAELWWLVSLVLQNILVLF